MCIILILYITIIRIIVLTLYTYIYNYNIIDIYIYSSVKKLDVTNKYVHATCGIFRAALDSNFQREATRLPASLTNIEMGM